MSLSEKLLQLPPDKKVENYLFSLKALLGAGTNSKVYLGLNDKAKTPVAIKVIDKRTLRNAYSWKQLQNEIEVMKAVNHQHVVKMLDVYQTQNNAYIITEYCNEGNLASLIQKKKFFEEKVALEIFADIVEGVKACAKVGILHRDLKPANILIHDGIYKLIDFGFARHIQQRDMLLQSWVGTPYYMSPQIINKRSYTSKCDVWSLGVILYEMLCGDIPWPAQNLIELANKVNTRPLSFPVNKNISEEVKALIRKCLVYNEQGRISLDQLFSEKLVFQNYNKNPNRKQLLPSNQNQRYMHAQSCLDLNQIVDQGKVNKQITTVDQINQKLDIQQGDKGQSENIQLSPEQLKQQQQLQQQFQLQLQGLLRHSKQPSISPMQIEKENFTHARVSTLQDEQSQIQVEKNPPSEQKIEHVLTNAMNLQVKPSAITQDTPQKFNYFRIYIDSPNTKASVISQLDFQSKPSNLESGIIKKVKNIISNKENINLQMERNKQTYVPSSKSGPSLQVQNEQKLNNQLKFVNNLYEIMQNLNNHQEFFNKMPSNMIYRIKQLLFKHAQIRCENIYQKQFIQQKNILQFENWDEFIKGKSFLKIKLLLKEFIDRIVRDSTQNEKQYKDVDNHFQHELTNAINGNTNNNKCTVDYLNSLEPNSTAFNSFSIEVLRQFLVSGNAMMIQFFQNLSDKSNQEEAQSIVNTFQNIVDFYNTLVGTSQMQGTQSTFQSINDKLQKQVENMFQPINQETA